MSCVMTAEDGTIKFVLADLLSTKCSKPQRYLRKMFCSTTFIYMKAAVEMLKSELEMTNEKTKTPEYIGPSQTVYLM